MLSLVLGLGNVGRRYRNSRHNLGFRVLEHLIVENKLPLQPETDNYSWAIMPIGSIRIILAAPKTFMNRSGIAARALLQQNEIDPGGMLVVVDDYYLPLGKIRIRRSGSDGGHNGLASIIEELGTDQFPRLRLGVGPLPESADPSEYVLGEFDSQEEESVEKMIISASDAVLFTIEHGLEEAMSVYNRTPAQPDSNIPG